MVAKSPSPAKLPSGNMKPPKRPKGQRTGVEHNTTLMALNSSELVVAAAASDSASDYQSDNLENNCKKKGPLTMAGAQYLDSPLLQNLVERYQKLDSLF